jgi:hypothetical protein
MKYAWFVIHNIALAFFVAIKVAGMTFAAWSWWWLLMPEVPVASIFVQKWGL